MGRTIIAEESLESNLSSLFNKDKWFIGVIIGQITDQKDYVLHLASTPKMESEDQTGTEVRIIKEETLDGVDESWIITHAKQVTRMLPGGIDILGIFAVAQPDVMKRAQAKLRQVLFAVFKGFKQNNPSLSSERIFLQISSLSKKITCKTFDVSDPVSAARPADWKYQRFADKMHRLESKLAVNCYIPVPNTSMSQSLQKQILNGLQPFCDHIQSSIATINNQVVAGKDLLVPIQPSSGKKGRKQEEEQTGKNFQVHFYEVMKPINKEDLRAPEVVPCGAQLTIKGNVTCVAYVHAKATKSEAIKALKMDVVRSLISRCQLLCEDFLQTEEEQDTKVMYETPLRVFAPLGDSTIQLCDYMFPDETNNDVVDRFKELLNVTVPEDMLETDCETLPDNSEIREAEPVEHDKEHVRGNFRKEETGVFQVIVFFLSIVVIILAILIAYLYQQDSDR